MSKTSSSRRPAGSQRLAGVRSLLFAPGNDSRKLTTALAGKADAVVADLEDAVAPDDKRLAREAVAAALSQPAGEEANASHRAAVEDHGERIDAAVASRARDLLAETSVHQDHGGEP